MRRGVIPFVLVAVAILGLVGVMPTRSVALLASALATPTVSNIPPCVDVTWQAADVRPPDPQDSFVIPAQIVPTPGGTPQTDEAGRELYMVVINLPPGQCMPYEAPGNHKNGAVVWIVQQGKVLYAWEPFPGADPTATPQIVRGDSEGNQDDLNDSDDGPGSPQILYPGDWVTQDRQVQVTYRNVGGDTAIVLKAVFAKPSGGGCPGDCR